ncbi:hypothetical protein KC349_g2859 [Hortaea werneckii]|nr:hypothetical protein KC349_g2859 [Hortaea werneckii]
MSPQYITQFDPKKKAGSRRQITAPTGKDTGSAAKARRIKTIEGYPNENTFPTHVDSLRKHVYNIIVDRLQRHSISTAHLRQEVLGFMLPKGNSELWERLSSIPISVTDVEMLSILDLERSNEQTPAPAAGSHIYYVRSFCLTIKELLGVIGSWERKRIWAGECLAWKTATEFILDPDEEVYVRYVGMTTRLSAWGRYADDLARREGGIYGAWIEALGSRCPHVLTECRVYSFPQKSTRAFRGKAGQILPLFERHVDLREQCLIALFGRSTLLNRQAGGWHSSYQPSDADHSQFLKLQTDAFSTMKQLTQGENYSQPSGQMQHEICYWVNRTVELSRAHPKELGTDKIPVTDGMETAWIQQAMPATILGYSIITIVGDYFPVAAMSDPTSFWHSPLRGPRWLKEVLARLQAFEEGRSHWLEGDIDAFVDAQVLPFIDYQYTPLRDVYREESANLMRQYFEMVQSLIVVTMERSTSGVVRANFVGLWSGHDFLPDVGEPAIQFWTDPGQVSGLGNKSKSAENEVEPEHCFIQVPSFHPGADKYTEHAVEFRRVFDMTWWQVVCLIHVALDTLANGENWQDRRNELCEEILKGFKKRWQASGCHDAFQAAKVTLGQYYAKKESQWTKDPRRAFRNSLDGQQVAVNQSGVVTVYWEKEASKRKVRVTLAGGRSTNVHPPKDATGADAVRTIHFLPTGVDIRMHDGTSCTYTRFKRNTTNPTFPGDVLRSKLTESGTAELKNLWELETSLDFDQTFPTDMAITGSSCTNCASIRETCGGQLPCPRCVRMGLTCVPQTLASAATGTFGIPGRQTTRGSATRGSNTRGLTTRGASSSIGGAGSGQGIKRKNTHQVVDDSSADIYDIPTVEEEEEEEEVILAAPSQAPQGKGKGKAKAGGGAEITGKCNVCRLMGTFCNGKKPCQRCVGRRLQCAYD